MAFLLLVLFFVVVLVAIRRGHPRVRRLSGLFAPRCANPRQGTRKGSDTAELRVVEPKILHALRDHTSRRTKICSDCIRKLFGKTEFRDLFKVILVQHKQHDSVLLSFSQPTPVEMDSSTATNHDTLR